MEQIMRMKLVVCAFLAVVAGVCLVTAQETSRPADDRSAARPPKSGATAKPVATRIASNAGHRPISDGGPIQDLVAKIVKAFNHGDAGEFAAAFTVDGEYIDEHGVAFHGRHAIEAEFASLFAAHQGAKIAVHLDAPRLIAPGVAAADGQSRLVHGAGQEPVVGKCNIVCAKEGAEWLIASLREVDDPVQHATHHEQVSQLDWLVGEWVSEGSASHVHFSCRWDETGNYLHRDFSIHVAGDKTSSGTQRIGYDPLTERLKTWLFDASGGFSDGYFHHDGERWIVQLSGVTFDGRMATGVNIFTRIDDHRMEWQALDCVVDGERIPDSGKITIVRKPPAPATRSR
jgi:uncharacterized protein (TIGR02246 family)